MYLINRFSFSNLTYFFHNIFHSNVPKNSTQFAKNLDPLGCRILIFSAAKKKQSNLVGLLSAVHMKEKRPLHQPRTRPELPLENLQRGVRVFPFLWYNFQVVRNTTPDHCFRPTSAPPPPTEYANQTILNSLTSSFYRDPFNYPRNVY